MKKREDQPEVRAIMDSIRNTVRALRVSSRACEKEFGVSAAQLFVLQQIERQEGLSLNDLAARTMTHQSSVSVVVSRLCERGFVARRSSQEDSRRLELSLTEAGKALLRQAPRAAQEDLVLALLKMEPARRKLLAELLTEVTSQAGFSEEGPAPMLEEEK